MRPSGLRNGHNGIRMGEDETAMLTTHRQDRQCRRHAGLLFEALDHRFLLSGGAGAQSAEAVLHDQPASFAQLDHNNSSRDDLLHRSPAALPANVSAGLRMLHRQYEDQAGDHSLAIRSARVAVRIKVAFPPALVAYVSALRKDGLDVIRTLPAYGEVEGTLPVHSLPAVAKLAAHVWAAALEGNALRAP